MENKKPQKPMSIEQAGNFLKEKNETMADDSKRAAKDAPISFASPEDRVKYLIYGISLLEDITEGTKVSWCMINNKAPALYTTKGVCDMLRKLLVLRINGYSAKQIAYHLHTTEICIDQSERLGITAIAEAIRKKRGTEIPLIGG